MKHKYGENAVCGIMTRQTNAGKGALRTAARMFGLQTSGDTMKYMATLDEINKKADELADGAKLNLADIKEGLDEYFKRNKEALTIIRYATLLDGRCYAIGQHAAGIIITDGKPVDEYVPLVYSEDNHIMVTQCDMIQAEKIGLLKMDFLGLNNLTIITDTLREIQRQRGIVIDMDTIPFEKEVFDNIFSKALTNSVFQFESPGMKKMLADFKPESIFDLTLLVAMFRPGPLQFLPDVIAVKNGYKEISYLTPELKPILEPTYGSITYQEQVQEIFRDLAGYSLGQADLVRRAMSKKKADVLNAERKAFVEGDADRGILGCSHNGISEEAANELFDQMMKFAEYAFNKSHAACYAVVAYQTAWLKYHYPIEYMKAVLNMKSFDNYSQLFRDLQILNIKLKQPDVNASEDAFSVQGGEIVYGLGKIKGLGESAVAPVVKDRRQRGKFHSLADFMNRVMPNKGLMEKLIVSGALDGLYQNRTALMLASKELVKSANTLRKVRKDIKLENDPAKKEKLLLKETKEEEKLAGVLIDNGVCEDQIANLEAEKELLGGYVSKQPLDLYPTPEDRGAETISAAKKKKAGNNVHVIGIVSGFRNSNRKSDGAQMGFFTLTDKTDSIEVCCFADAYQSCNGQLYDNAVIEIDGRLMKDDRNPDVLKLAVKTVTTLSPVKDVIILYVNTVVDWIENLKEKVVSPYLDPNGNQLLIYDKLMGEFRTDTMNGRAIMVTPAILDNPKLRTSIKRMKI